MRETANQLDAVHASAILADALEALEEQERETIRRLLAPNTIKIDDALHEAYNTAKEVCLSVSRAVSHICSC